MKKENISKVEFEEVYEEYKDAVLQTAMIYLGLHAAEDITQEVFVRYFTLPKGDNVKNVRAWLMTVARNLAYNYVRDSRRTIAIDMETAKDNLFGCEESTEETYFEGYRGKSSEQLQESILDRLYRENVRWFEAVTMTYGLKRPQKEVAEYMGITEEALHSVLYRAKQWVRKNYRAEYEERKML